MTEIKKSTTTQSKEIFPLIYKETGKKWTPSTAITSRIIESGEHLVPYLVSLIDQAERMICFNSFIFQKSALTDALSKAADRGVQIFVLTSTVHLAQQNIYDTGTDFRADNFKKLLENEFQNKIMVRCAGNFHAKFMLIDPTSKNSKGLLATCNFTIKAMKQNPEIVAQLKPTEVKELFKVFTYHFWEAATDEQTNQKDFSKVKPAEKCKWPSLEKILVTSTVANKNTIKEYLKASISKAKEQITISTYAIDQHHELTQLLLKKCTAGVKVSILMRRREDKIKQHLTALAEAGAVLYLHPLLHAKFIYVDKSDGAVFTANFEKHGMDDGFEIGLKLGKTDLPEFSKLIDRWKQSMPLVSKNQVSIQEIQKEYINSSFKKISIRSETVKDRTVQPSTIGGIINAWNQKSEFDQSNIQQFHYNLTVRLTKFTQTIDHRKTIQTGVELIDYSTKPTKKKKVQKGKALLINEKVDFNELNELKQYKNLSIFALN